MQCPTLIKGFKPEPVKPVITPKKAEAPKKRVKQKQKTVEYVNSEVKKVEEVKEPVVVSTPVKQKPVKKSAPVIPDEIVINVPVIPVPVDQTWDVVKGTKKPVRKLTLASNLIARVIGRSGCNVNAIRDVTQTHIDIEKPKKGGGDRTITIRGNNDSTTMAYTLMEELINHPDKEIEDIIAHHIPSESKKRQESKKLKDETEKKTEESVKMVSIQDALAAVALNEKVNTINVSVKVSIKSKI